MKLIWKRGSGSLFCARTSITRPSSGVAFTSFGNKISKRVVVGLGGFFLLAACAGKPSNTVSTIARRRFFKRVSLGEGQFITPFAGASRGPALAIVPIFSDVLP